MNYSVNTDFKFYLDTSVARLNNDGSLMSVNSPPDSCSYGSNSDSEDSEPDILAEEQNVQALCKEVNAELDNPSSNRSWVRRQFGQTEAYSLGGNPTLWRCPVCPFLSIDSYTSWYLHLTTDKVHKQHFRHTTDGTALASYPFTKYDPPVCHRALSVVAALRGQQLRNLHHVPAPGDPASLDLQNLNLQPDADNAPSKRPRN